MGIQSLHTQTLVCKHVCTSTRSEARPPTPPHPSSTAYRSVLAAEGLFKAYYFAHASLMTMGRPAATPRGPPLRFLCLVVALEHANEISRFSLKTEGVHIGRLRPSRATPRGINLPNGTNPRRRSRLVNQSRTAASMRAQLTIRYKVEKVNNRLRLALRLPQRTSYYPTVYRLPPPVRSRSL